MSDGSRQLTHQAHRLSLAACRDESERADEWLFRALSWYFLNLFGLNGVFKLILGSENGEPPRIHHYCLTCANKPQPPLILATLQRRPYCPAPAQV